MQNSSIPEEQPADSGAGESSHTAANAASSQADATGSMTPDQTAEEQSTGSGESTMAHPDAIARPS